MGWGSCVCWGMYWWMGVHNHSNFHLSFTPPPQSFLHSFKPADLTLEEAGSRLRQALDKVRHTQHPLQSYVHTYSVCVTACTCHLSARHVTQRCNVFNSVTPQCHTTQLTVTQACGHDSDMSCSLICEQVSNHCLPRLACLVSPNST